MVGGPLGALGGAVLGVAVNRVARAVAVRFSDLERERMGATIGLIVEESQKRNDQGERLRDDGFFEEADGLRAEGEEVLEGVLRQAAATYEQRKLPFLAHLYASAVYDEAISGATAVFLVRQAESLTYRQLIALALAHAREQGEKSGADRFFQRTIQSLLERDAQPDPGITAEQRSLVDAGLLLDSSEDKGLSLSGIGRLLVKTMQLDQIPDKDIEAFIFA